MNESRKPLESIHSELLRTILAKQNEILSVKERELATSEDLENLSEMKNVDGTQSVADDPSAPHEENGEAMGECGSDSALSDRLEQPTENEESSRTDRATSQTDSRAASAVSRGAATREQALEQQRRLQQDAAAQEGKLEQLERLHSEAKLIQPLSLASTEQESDRAKSTPGSSLLFSHFHLFRNYFFVK